MSDAQLFKTSRGVFQLFTAENLGPEAKLPPGHVRVLNVQTGSCSDFSSEADAMAWIKGKRSAPHPLAMPKPTPEELARWEAIEREVDAKYGTDEDPLANW